jgi:hypothetical protein
MLDLVDDPIVAQDLAQGALRRTGDGSPDVTRELGLDGHEGYGRARVHHVFIGSHIQSLSIVGKLEEKVKQKLRIDEAQYQAGPRSRERLRSPMPSPLLAVDRRLKRPARSW